MEVTLGQALRRGVAAHKEGKLQDAERFYRAILQVRPDHPDANHNLGVLAVSAGKPLAALTLFKLALETNPQVAQFWISYVDALIKLERFEDAELVLSDAEQSGVSATKLKGIKLQVQASLLQGAHETVKSHPLSENRKLRGPHPDASPSQDQIDLLLRHYQSGSLKEAEKLATTLTQSFPNHAFGWTVLGALLAQTGRLYDSLPFLQKSVDLSPADARAHWNLAKTLQRLGSLEEAETSFKKALAVAPDFVEAYSNLGAVLQEQGRLDAAEASLRKAIALNPEFAEAHRYLAVTLKNLARLEEAEASCRQAIALKPDYAEAYFSLGNTLADLARPEEAETSYRHAVALKPDYAEAHSNLGITLREMGMLNEAEVSFQQAIALKPDYAEVHCNLGITFQELGKLDEAQASYRRAIELNPDLAKAHRNLALTKKFLSRDDHFCQMEALYKDRAMPDHDRCLICFALAKASEDLEDFSRAFQFYAEANALRKKHLGYDRAQDTNLFQMLKAHYPRIREHAFPPELAAVGCIPIFIIGMPRSGTTLVEQIISSHPQVTGAGELPFLFKLGGALALGQTPVDGEVLKTFREQYLSSLQKRSEGNALVTDKMPHNFRLLGLITSAFPEAKIIHVRRHPAAVCWANYTQYFVQNSLGYCYSLEDTLHYHGLYEDLMQFWQEAFPGRIHDLDYERLTGDQEAETRKLIDYLRLEWDDACLSPQDNKRGVSTASSSQVRQIVYAGSSERWKRYRPYLNGAIDHLSTGDQ